MRRGLADDAGDLDAPSPERDHEHDVEARYAGPSENLDGEEIAGRDRSPMGA